ncbi:DUF2336 domain-containing protein [Rhodopseudomonas pseudopalustris]|uniref:DUF2336 domain-containing protein n=2 Tax=Rhodopseudomonas TaxID=1073 RepID=Q139U1_RHOPS|nr:DUF2336 domain-containing protein [Rhodopseudomonas pseudopalustris]ABE39148.1 conserved hypothetical protein [Rhodopseudomonas palustris BisB5]MBB1093009.1 DUF2336 domain-containing protein [Rhodopseudomonas palustris]SEO71817.1 hypothetical protein SAMN05444123_104187 [Rhodopseudomonas pseudopalustris]
MSSKSALSAANLLDELQSTLAHGTVARRVETLRRVTDLYLDGEVDYTEDQISVFDDVFNCLVRNIETNAKVLLAQRLAPVNAPPRIIHHLAFEDMIEIAAPVLTQSEQLDDATLIANARTKGQGHMMAISNRKSLSGAVTDVLVEIGNQQVVQSTVKNPGAEFSDNGYSMLARRAEQDDDLATELGKRAIPRAQYLKLIAIASASVRTKLKAANPTAASEVSSAVKKATSLARSAHSTVSRQTNIAHGLVRALFEDGRINEDQIFLFANEQKFDEINQAIACLAGTSVETVESMMVESRDEGLLILAKVCNFSWSTVNAIIHMRDELTGTRSGDLEECRLTYDRLRNSTAQQVLRFHRMQQSTATAKPPAA